jgi:hypothetical protein
MGPTINAATTNTKNFNKLYKYLMTRIKKYQVKGYGGDDIPLDCYHNKPGFEDDLKFMIELLERMGYDVKRNTDETRVPGHFYDHLSVCDEKYE